MPWGAAIGAGVSALANHALNSSSNGGAGTQTTDKSPWLAAQPWITSNLSQGQALQNRYAAQPFSALQNQAYQNQANQSAYMRAAVPSLLGQIQSQQVGFDRANPNARPNAFSFDGLLSAAREGAQAAQAQAQPGGLLGLLTSAPAQPLNLNANAPAPAPAPQSTFKNLDVTNPMNAYYGQMLAGSGAGLAATNSPGANAWLQALQQSAGGAGYGTFKYGMAMPMPGTQEYRDLQEYLAYGGADPYNLYGARGGGLYGNHGGSSVGIDGIGVAGSDSAVGSSANF